MVDGDFKWWHGLETYLQTTLWAVERKSIILYDTIFLAGRCYLFSVNLGIADF